MKTEILSAATSENLSQALQVLKEGGMVAFPTDTVYGLGANAYHAQAIAKLYEAKGRSRENPIPILIANMQDLTRVSLSPPPMARRLAKRFWPGPITLIIWRKSNLPNEISPTSTVGVRVPDHHVAQALLTIAGPLAVTSANRSGDPIACTASEVFEGLGGSIDLILDGGRTPGGEPSTVVDCTRASPRILREGPISEAEIHEVLTKG
jgi:L-threonylcarbamoyladenylate synthase